MEELYTRQEEIDLTVPRSVAIIGCGGVGTWAGLFAAMTGIKEIYLFDDDEIEENNLNRLPYSYYEVGKKKTEALKDLISRVRPNTAVHTFGNYNKITKPILETNNIRAVIACTDNLKSQVKIHIYCKKHDIRFIRAGYDGNHITLLNHIPTWIASKSTGGGYNIVPSWVAPAVVVGALAIFSLCKKRLKLTGILDNIMALEPDEHQREDDNNDDFRRRMWRDPMLNYSHKKRRKRTY